MTAKKRRRPTGRPEPAHPSRPEKVEPDEAATAPEVRRPFGGALFGGGPSPMPPSGPSLAKGFQVVLASPVLLVVAIVMPLLAWLGLLAIGFEGSPGRLVDVLALPPISTYFDLGTSASLVGVGPAVLAFTAVSILLRSVLYAVLAGLIVEQLQDGRTTRWGLLHGLAAIPTVVVAQVMAFSLIVAGNLVFPVLGPGIGFLAFVAALVGGLYFLGFAPTAAVRQHRGVVETIRRSGRAAMLPGSRQLMLCALYFFFALPVVVGLAPGGASIAANPSFVAWLFVLAVNVAHLAFMATLAYRWIEAEDAVPEQPVPRRRTAPERATRRR